MTQAEKEFTECIEILVSPEDWKEAIVADADKRLRYMRQDAEAIQKLATQLFWEKAKKHIEAFGNPVFIDADYLEGLARTNLLAASVQDNILKAALEKAKSRRWVFNSGVDPV